LALIVHYLRLVTGEADHEDVDGVTLDRAGQLVAYFQSQARKVYALMDADPRVAAARKVLRWVTREVRHTFSKRDVYQDLKGTFPRVEDLDEPLALLVRHNYCRAQPEPERTGPGRRPSPVYDVNPYLHPHNSHNPQN